MANPLLNDMVATLEMARERFVYGLDKVPDDHLEWTPGGASRNALALAGRQAGFLGFIAHAIRSGAMPERSGGFPPPPENRETARAAVEGGFNALIEAVRGLSDEDLKKELTAPWGAKHPIAQWLWFISSVVGYGQGQLNFLQLCYGDEDPNIPPSWQHG